MDKAKIVHQIRRLTIASDAFQQAMSLLNHIEKIGLGHESDLYSPMIAGVVVTYAKNFNRADGLGPLPSSYTRFPKTKLNTAHTKVMDSRNKIHAHRDSSIHSFKSDDAILLEYPVEMRVNADNTAFLFQPKLVDIPPKRIPDIKELIQFQLDRLQNDLDKKLGATVDFTREYKQGVVYLLGEDFP